MAWALVNLLKRLKPLFFPPLRALLWEEGEATASLLDRLGNRKKDLLPYPPAWLLVSVK